MTYVHLKQVSNRHFYAVPSLLFNLRSLRYLSLQSLQNLVQHPTDWRTLLESLPTTLETLCIRSPDASKAFLNCGPSNELTIIETDYGRGNSDWIDVGALYPSLTRLELSCDLHELNIAGLPPSLRELQVPRLSYRIHLYNARGLLISRLPRSLERLEASIYLERTTCEEWHSQAPPALEYVRQIEVDMFFRNSSLFSGEKADLVAWIPPTIQIGHLHVSGWLGGLLPTNVKSISVTPKPNTTIDSMADIPRAVTSMTFQRRLPTSPFTQMPPNLATLILYDNDALFTSLRTAISEGFDVETVWPKTLQTLHVSAQCHLSDLKLVPKTLTSLEMLSCCSEEGIQELKLDAKDFPPNLTFCTMIAKDNNCYFAIDGPLPASLTSFCSAVEQCPPCRCTRETIENSLPDSLTDLTFGMSDNPLYASTAWTLPAQLTTLRVHHWTVRWLETLPRQLASLTIGRLVDLQYSQRPLDFFAPMPPSLTYFRLLGSWDDPTQSGLSTASLASLVHLRELNCHYKVQFTSAIFRNIPKSLRRLKIGLFSDDPKDAPFLPPWLQTCSLASTSIDWKTTLLTKYWPPQEAFNSHAT